MWFFKIITDLDLYLHQPCSNFVHFNRYDYVYIVGRKRDTSRWHDRPKVNLPSTIGAQKDSKWRADFLKKIRHQRFSWGLKLTEKTTPNSSFCIMLPSSKVKQPSALLNIRAILISQTSKKPHLIKISWSSWFSSGKPAQHINTHMYKYMYLVVSTICFGGDH